MPAKEEYWRNPEKHREATKAYNQAHTDWKRKANREWAAQKRLANPEWAKGEQKKYRARLTPEQKAERAEYQRQWFAANPTYSRDKQREDHARYPAKRMVEAAKHRARKAGIPFDLDWRLIEVPTHCPVLGIELKPGVEKQDPASPTIDRLIPALGYVLSNVRVVSYSANAIKRDKSLAEMEQYAAALRAQLGGAVAVLTYMRRELG